MQEYDFYNYIEDKDKIIIYTDELNNYFDVNCNIIIKTIDFDENQNVVLFIEHSRNHIEFSKIAKKLLENFQHLNNVEIKDMKIILTFNSKKIELC